GLSPELVALLNGAGYQTLHDILDIEGEDIQKIAGMTPEASEQLMGFLSELTEDEGEESRPEASRPEASPPEASPPEASPPEASPPEASPPGEPPADEPRPEDPRPKE